MILPTLDTGIVALAGSKVAVLIAAYIVLVVVMKLLKSGSKSGYSRGGYGKGGSIPKGFVRADKGSKEWKKGIYVTLDKTERGQGWIADREAKKAWSKSKGVKV